MNADVDDISMTFRITMDLIPQAREAPQAINIDRMVTLE
jgi:hypothetical protein